ncbi:MAG TPA: NAD(P)H-dependent glycerol-3-phosphate dehydrogenase [Nitrospiria bacterium]|nr:NAD(P)H-dependent glycerol-3-phosphate dehydrogenase [Nitrospiria bacterium]
MSSSYQFKRASVIGAGSWGTALAILLSSKGEVRHWAFEKEVAETINRDRENKTYFPGVVIPLGVKATNSLEEALADTDLVIFVVPSHAARSVLSQMVPFLRKPVPFISATKGIENNTLLLPTQIMKEVLPRPFHARLCALSGPSFAREIAQNQPTAVVLATGNKTLALPLQKHLTSAHFIVYLSTDIVGVQIGGALKNVIAIATGCSDGLGFGDNSRAALITRGLSEIIRLGSALGAKKETFAGLSGIGDLILTATSRQSRNYSVGFKIGKGIPMSQITGESPSVAEGIKTSFSVHQLSKKLRVDMPITEQLYKILYENKEPKKAVDELIYRAAHARGKKLEF